MKNLIRDYLLIVVLVCLLLVSWKINFSDQQFVWLAESFSQGQVSMRPPFKDPADWVEDNGKYYWPQGPLPGVILIPGVLAVGLNMKQVYFQVPFILASVWLVFKIAIKELNSKQDALYIVLAFVTSSYLGMIFMHTSWIFAQVISIFLSLLLIFNTRNQGKYSVWWSGVLLSLLFATRITAGVVGLAFLNTIILNRKKDVLRSLAVIAILIFATASVLGWYNWVRFENIFDQGYERANIGEIYKKDMVYGLMDLRYLPGHLYYMFLKEPKLIFDGQTHNIIFPWLIPDSWGMGLIWTSPYFLWFFTVRNWSDEKKVLLWPIGLGIILVGMYALTGYRQYGYRYAWDFLPYVYWLLILLIAKSKGFSERMKLFIIVSALLNCYLFVWFFIFG